MTAALDVLPLRIDWLHSCGRPVGEPCPDPACPHLTRRADDCTPIPCEKGPSDDDQI